MSRSALLVLVVGLAAPGVAGQTVHGELQSLPRSRRDRRPDLTDAEWARAKGSYLSIASTIMAGVPETDSSRGIPMPPRGGSNLSDPEVQDVAAYVWYISHHP